MPDARIFFLLADKDGHLPYWNPAYNPFTMRPHVRKAREIYLVQTGTNYMVTITGTLLKPHYLFQEVTDPNLKFLLTGKE